MLTIYRRHREDCRHKSEGRKYRRCRCPIWVDGFIGQEEIRKATGLRDWEKAQAKVRDWEAEGQLRVEVEASPITISSAKGEFLRDAEARNLREKTIYKYRLLLRQLEAFAQAEGVRFLNELDVRCLRRFRSTWKDGNLAALKKLERLRTFLRFALANKWIKENPAAEIKNPRVHARPTLPFTHEEMIRILKACDDSYEESGKTGKANMLRIRPLVLMLRYSGMRIGDAVGCAVERLNGKKLLLYTQKTGVPVYCPLPDFVVSALEEMVPTSERYFFWTGGSKLQTATGDWQAKLKKLFEKANIADGHAHRIRDTFAVELLLANVPIERVSILLGHTSIRITERHYTPWVRARQEQAEADVRGAWAQDPVALLETKGTPEVHGKSAAVN
jgi:integrase/recombinase XerD